MSMMKKQIADKVAEQVEKTLSEAWEQLTLTEKLMTIGVIAITLSIISAEREDKKEQRDAKTFPNQKSLYS